MFLRRGGSIRPLTCSGARKRRINFGYFPFSQEQSMCGSGQKRTGNWRHQEEPQFD